MANELAATYTASDGVKIELTPETVAAYMLIGEQQLDQREMASVISKCKARKLNPLAGDAYITVFKGKASIIISRDYMNRVANTQDTFKGIRSGVITWNNSTGSLDYKNGEFYLRNYETLVGAWAEVLDSRFEIPLRCEISKDEYDTGRNVWASKPATMLVKVAEMHCLRKAYPGSFGGLYDQSEMPSDSPQSAIEVKSLQVPQETIEMRKNQLWSLTQTLAALKGLDARDLAKQLCIEGDPAGDYKLMSEDQWNTYRANIIAEINELRDAQQQVVYEIPEGEQNV